MTQASTGHDHDDGHHDQREPASRLDSADTAHSHEESRGGLLSIFERVGLLHGHSHAPNLDDAMAASDQGIRAVKVSLVLLGITAAIQVVVYLASGSVALLADTVHNFSDASTSVPLWIAFAISRRPATRRFTHGFARSEDLAGLFIIALILVSAVVAAYESYRRLLDPTSIDNVQWVIVAAVVGFIGNEIVAEYRIRAGRSIGSAALMADGQHARVDGLTSLAVLFGAIGSLAGAPIIDPIVGLAITVAILFIAKDAGSLVWHRLMDAVEPELLEQLEATAADVVREQHGALGIEQVRMRWLGHSLQAELNLQVDDDLSTRESHRIAEELRHALFHAIPRLTSVNVHVDPVHDGSPSEHHELTEHHR